jgi:hypothetical protein
MPDPSNDDLESLIETGFMEMLKKKSISSADLDYLQVLKEAKGWIAVKQRREPEGQGAELAD